MFIDPLGLDATLDEYINANYKGQMTISLVIDQPIIDSRTVAYVDINGVLKNGHSFIRLDDGKGNVQYVGLAAENPDFIAMLRSLDVPGKIVDDKDTNWDVAKVYTITEDGYKDAEKFIDMINMFVPTYNVETYNCTTFAAHIVGIAINSKDLVDIYEHNWTLPNDLSSQLQFYFKNKIRLPVGMDDIGALIVDLFMGNNYGYTPADAAEDLKSANGTVLIKDSTNTVRSK